ncbi:MAG: metal-dependent transcriptional regulator [Oscillospiraceae bacterium]|nr:metal-dependent transcriptional regulator [Oscillospiraceae bacterium]
MTNSLVEYLKAIYIISNEQAAVRVTDIANLLGYSKPSVNRALNNLKNEGLIEYSPYSNIVLTEEGKVSAGHIMKRHGTLKLFLTEVLEVDDETAETEAKSMKYAVSEHTISKLEQYINKILDLGDLECGYNIASERCRKCVKISKKKKQAWGKE